MEMVKLLVEHGADFNAVWRKDSNALTYAIQYGQAEIEQYLRSKGAKLPSELAADAALGASGQGGQASRTPTLSLDDSILEHIRQHLGEPMPLTLRPLVPGDLPITIHVVPLHDGRSALVTTGMSHRPMTVPPEQVMYQFAELVMFLPPELEVEVGKEVSPVVGDLCARMRQLAEYPHQNETWLGPATIIDFEEPLAVGTRMSCILAVTEDSEFGQLSLEDAGPILFYFLVPLYSEERDLERRTNTEHLLEMLGRHGIDKTVDLKRRNVAHL